jgi:hypothetical protein
VKLCHWPTGPVEYCGECATQMLRVAQARGVHVAVEPIPLPYVFTDDTLRAIDLRSA